MPKLLCEGLSLAGLAVLAFVFHLQSAERIFRHEDSLTEHSKWVGKLTQGGSHPTTNFAAVLDAHLTVVRREGNNVELELRETSNGLDVTFLCRGTVVRLADGQRLLDFRSYGVKQIPNASIYITDVPYSARLVGNALKGMWKYTNHEAGINLRGDFNLTLIED